MVKAEATESARIAAAEMAYLEKAQAVHGELKAAIAAGTAFADATAKYNLALSQTEPFNISTQLADEFGQQIKVGAISVEAGQLAELIPTADEYLLAYVVEKVPGDEAATLPGMRDELAGSLRNEKASQLLVAWQESLLEEAGFEDLTARPSDEDQS